MCAIDMRKRCYLGGFTLIELLIVMSIIGVIAALVMGPVGSQIQRSQRLRVMADVQTVSRMVPLLAAKRLCTSSLHIDAQTQALEARVCGEVHRRYDLPHPYFFLLRDQSTGLGIDVSDGVDVWYGPRSGGASMMLEVHDASNTIQTVSLASVLAHHPVK